MPPPGFQHRSSHKRARRTKSLSPVSAAPAIINQLPFEILSRIFDLCVDSDESDEFVELDEMNVPFVLLKVCKHWKSVALRTPVLWNKLYAPEYTTEENARTVCKFISTWLSVSGSLPLHLAQLGPGRYFGEGPGEQEAAQHARQILQLYIAHEHRWQTLDIAFVDYLLDAFHPYLEKSRVDEKSGGTVMGARLRLLRITLNDSVQGAQQKLADLFKWVSSLPALKKMELTEDNEEGHILDDLSIVPFERLKVIRFARRTMSFQDSLEIARRCISASELTLEIDNYEGEPWSSDGSLPAIPNVRYTLPNLSRLSLVGVERPLDILRCLLLPNLECLRISLEIAKFPGSCKILEEFLAQLRRPLQTFTVYDEDLLAEDALDIYMLPALRHVRNVTLSSTADAAKFLFYVGRLVGRTLSYGDCSGGSQPSHVGVPDFVIWALDCVLEKKEDGEYPEQFWLGRKVDYWQEWDVKGTLVIYKDQEFHYSKRFVEVFSQQGVTYASVQGSRW